jgi:succinate dehydrogenase / fumarate reductase, membrane anchor subunit
MVMNVMSYSGNGFRDWLVQRVSAVVLAAYVLFLIAFTLSHDTISYNLWHDLFACLAMKIATLVVLLCLLLHAWIGVWTIFTDYVKPTCLRIMLEVTVILALVTYFFWGLLILWGVK